MGKTRAVFPLIGALTLILTVAGPALSTHQVASAAGGFEGQDGNLVPSSGGINFDWNSFATVNWNTNDPPDREATKTVSGWSFKGIEDAEATTADDGFAGGTKQDDECARVVTAKAANKTDLKRIYLSSKIVPVHSVDHVFLALGWIRIPQNTTSASAHVAFEFNQGSTSCGSASDGLVHRSLNDILVLYDFEGGSEAPTVRISKWITSGACEVSSNSPPCWGSAVTLNDRQAQALVNTGAPVTDALTPPVPPAATSVDGTLGVKEFGEAIVDLSAAGVFSSVGCQTFGTAYGVSRSSGNSGTAQMKDLVGPSDFTLTNCATVNVTKSGSDSGAQTGAVFTLYEGSNTSGTVVGTCTVDSAGQCGSTPSFSNLLPGTYTIDETTVPNGYNKDATLPHTFSVTAGESKVLSFTNVAAPGDIHIAKEDDAGNALNGAVFTLYQGATTSGTVVGTCTTGTSNYPSGTPSPGSCSFLGITPGQYTVDETTVPTGYSKASGLPQTFTLTNGGTVNLPSTGNAYQNPKLFKVIVLVCQKSDDSLYAGKVSFDGAAVPGTANSPTTVDSAIDETKLCQLSGTYVHDSVDRAGNDHSATVRIP